VGPAVGPQKLSKKAAQRQADEQVLNHLNAQAWVPQTLISVDQFVTRHFDPEIVWTMKESGKQHYKYMFKLLLPLIGKRQLRELSVADVQNVVRSLMSRGLSVQTATHAKNAISAIVSHAKRLGMFTGENPASLVRMPPMVRHPKPALNWEQAQKALMITPEPYRTMALMSMTTSLNVAELTGLKWGRVNLTDRTVYLTNDDLTLPPKSFGVIQNYYRGKYGSVKTTARNRVQPISDDLAEALGNLRSTEASDDAPVFASRNGTPIDAHNANNRIWKKVGKAIGVPGLSWHSFRRTAATLTNQVGMSKADRIALMGHSNDQMTDHYTESDIERRRRYLDQVSARITESQPGSDSSARVETQWQTPTTGIA
jgi:integrase